MTILPKTEKSRKTKNSNDGAWTHLLCATTTATATATGSVVFTHKSRKSQQIITNQYKSSKIKESTFFTKRGATFFRVWQDSTSRPKGGRGKPLCSRLSQFTFSLQLRPPPLPRALESCVWRTYVSVSVCMSVVSECECECESGLVSYYTEAK